MVKKITLMSVVGMLCLCLNVSAQKREYPVGEIYLNSRLPDINLGKFINYKDSTVSFSEFKNKLIILDFWFLGCGACIAQFPIQDSLQQQFAADIQIIPVTFNSKSQVNEFLQNWKNSNSRSLSLPFIVEDTLLNTLFSNASFPHYVWIAQDRRVIGYTTEQFLTAEHIKSTLEKTASIRHALLEDPTIPDKGITETELFNFYFRKTM